MFYIYSEISKASSQSSQILHILWTDRLIVLIGKLSGLALEPLIFYSIT